MVTEIRVRAPVPSDGPGIGKVHARAWRRAYSDVLSPRFLADLDETVWGQAWYRRIAARTAGCVEEANELLVAERHGQGESSDGENGELVGVATIGVDRDDPACHQGELWMINVLPEAWGTGVGHALLAAAEERLADRGFDTAVLWVVAGNTRARRFYERNGWVYDGSAKMSDLGGATVRECRYRRRLRPSLVDQAANTAGRRSTHGIACSS